MAAPPNFTTLTSANGLGPELKTANAQSSPPGKALSLDAGAHSPSAPRLLHSKASCDRGKLPIDGEHPAFAPTSTSAHDRTDQKRALYVAPPDTRAYLLKSEKPMQATKTFMVQTSARRPRQGTSRGLYQQLQMRLWLWPSSTINRARNGTPMLYAPLSSSHPACNHIQLT